MRMTKSERNLMFIVLMISSIATSLLQTALTTAIPAIMRDFEISASTGQWLTSVYSLAMGIMVPATAFLMKRFTTKKLFLGSIVLFATGTIVCLFSPYFTTLVIGRVMQGLGNGIILPMTQVIILTIYPIEQRGSVMGIYGLAVGAAPVVAPTLAGILIDLWNWRAIFYIIIVIVAIDILLALKAIKNISETEETPFDFVSMILCTIGFSCLLLGLGNAGSDNFFSVNIIIPIVIGLLSLILFVRKQLRSNDPFLQIRVLQVKDYRMAVIMSMLFYSIMTAGSTIFPLYIQNICDKTATESGLMMMPGSLVMAIISPFAGKIYDKFGIRNLVLFGSLLQLLSCIGTLWVNETTPIFYISAVYIVRLISIGCMLMPIVTWGMSSLGEEQTAHGTALLTSLRTISGAFGSAIFVAIMTSVTRMTLSSAVDVTNVPANAAGVDVAFAGMTVFALIQLVLAFLFVGSKKHSKNIFEEIGCHK